MFPKFLLAVLPCLLLMSCATSQQKISIRVPEGSTPPVKGKVALTSVTDKRVFEENPSDPSAPSLGMQTKAGTNRDLLIGRRRDLWGKAHANVELSPGQTVTERTRAILTEGLARRGYAVDASGSPMEVGVLKFWTWLTPGAWVLTLEAKIECEIKLSGGRRIVVRGYGDNYCQSGSVANRELVFERAVEDFLKNLDTELAASGF